ncbi:MAG: sigma-70 family RNA polymerase sigma factor [Planctomycetes bacterium]|nr:sigma-70 family RNA polymerase sigma factor [Planctomycetota bacterium]
MPTDDQGTPDVDLQARLTELTPRLYGWVHLRLSGRLGDEVDDVVQETLFRALGRLDRFHGGSLAAWVFQIANNVVLEMLRKARRKPRQFAASGAVSGLPESDIIAQATTLTRAVARRDDVRAVLELAAGFEESDRRVLMLCGLQGLPAREAGLALGMSAEATQKRWYRLRQKLHSVPWIAAETSP